MLFPLSARRCRENGRRAVTSSQSKPRTSSTLVQAIHELIAFSLTLTDAKGNLASVRGNENESDISRFALEGGWSKLRLFRSKAFEMSRAFIKEDIDLPERFGRVRSPSGLPPGAMNYMTRRGAGVLQAELATLRETPGDRERMAELERILASATIVDPPEGSSNSVAFGAVVTVEDAAGETQTYRVVGVDELNLAPDAVSWISTAGKTLLAAELGQRVTLTGDKPVRIVKIEYH